MTKTEREAELAEFEQNFNGGIHLPGGEAVSTLTDAVNKSQEAAAATPAGTIAADPKPASEPDKKAAPVKLAAAAPVDDKAAAK